MGNSISKSDESDAAWCAYTTVCKDMGLSYPLTSYEREGHPVVKVAYAAYSKACAEKIGQLKSYHAWDAYTTACTNAGLLCTLTSYERKGYSAVEVAYAAYSKACAAEACAAKTSKVNRWTQIRDAKNCGVIPKESFNW